eukprot:1911842-Pyramimonas_sp.AAC.2
MGTTFVRAESTHAITHTSGVSVPMASGAHHLAHHTRLPREVPGVAGTSVLTATPEGGHAAGSVPQPTGLVLSHNQQ